MLAWLPLAVLFATHVQQMHACPASCADCCTLSGKCCHDVDLSKIETGTCTEMMNAADISYRFAPVVGHGVHSIKVEDLQQFEPSATENNTIPTVNLDLASDVPILGYAPSSGQRSMFATPGMRMTDRVLSHMDDNHHDIRQYSPLEKLVHALHMQEVWYKARDVYRHLASVAPPTQQLCGCVLDFDNNGIMKMLRFLALQIREPQLMYGSRTVINNHTVIYMRTTYSYTVSVQADAQKEVLLSEADAIRPLQDQQSWALWKKSMMSHQPSDNYEFAVFLYCALHKN